MKYKDYLNPEENLSLRACEDALRDAAIFARNNGGVRLSDGRHGAALTLFLGAVPGAWFGTAFNLVDGKEQRSRLGSQEQAAAGAWSVEATIGVSRAVSGKQYASLRKHLLEQVRARPPKQADILACLALHRPGVRGLPGYRPKGFPGGSRGLLEPLEGLPGTDTALLPELARIWQEAGGPNRASTIIVLRGKQEILLSATVQGGPSVTRSVPTAYRRTGQVTLSKEVSSIADLFVLARQGNRLYREMERGRFKNEYNLPTREYLAEAISFAKHLLGKHKVAGVDVNFVMRLGESSDVSIIGLLNEGMRVLWGLEPPYKRTDRIVCVPVGRGEKAHSGVISRIMRRCEDVVRSS